MTPRDIPTNQRITNEDTIMSTLMKASEQWSTRPADEKFNSLQSLHDAVTHYQDISREADHVDPRSLVASTREFDDDGTVRQEPVLVGPSGDAARFSHFSFGQVARLAGAPAAYLRGLPAALAATNLNHGLGTRDADSDLSLLFSENGGLRLRAAVTDHYTRIWNSDITARLLRLVDRSPEWQPAPAAFDGSRGLYASDHDMFAFLVDNDRRIFETEKGGGLGRGFFVWNSEVGAASFGIMTFYYEYVCGNHRVWGASGVQELRIPHVGNADERAFSKLTVELRKYADSSASADEAKVTAARVKMLGDDKDAVLDAVLGLSGVRLTRQVAGKAFDRAVEHAEWYGDPKSVWGFTGGLTEIARDMPHTDDRVALDRTAGKIMKIAF